MEDLINRIITIEEEAQEVIREAEEKALSIESSAEKKSEFLEKDILEKAELKIKSIDSLEAEYAEAKISGINEKLNRQKKELADRLEQNKEKWVAEILKATLA
ncbi:MAG: hypothetical protein J6N52_10970 [Clostridia bacterium]|nr:hypothetical protein [Clostridia bacterium]